MPDIGIQEVNEIDGGIDPKPVVGAIGGLLGQIILTLSIMEKNFNRQLTSKSTKSKKSSKSGKSSRKGADESAKKGDDDAKSHKSGKSGKSAKSRKSSKSKGKDGADIEDEVEVDPNPLAEPPMKEKGWFTKQNIQNFIHYFI